MMQVIAHNGVVEENDSNSFFPLVDSLRFEVKFKSASALLMYPCYYCCLGWSRNKVHV